MILERGAKEINLPAERIGSIVVIHARAYNGTPKRTTTMMRYTREAMDGARGQTGVLRGMPVTWCPREDGAIDIWPTCDQDYEVVAMGRDGRPYGAERKAVAVQPVEQYIASANKAFEESQRVVNEPPRVERFTMLNTDGEE